VTITAWIYPNNNEAGHVYGGIGYLGLVICSSQVAEGGLGLGYSGSTDASGNYTLGCVWNGNLWDSGLAAPPGQWSFVALVVTPTSITMNVMNTSNVLSATTSGANGIVAFNAPTLIGDNSTDNGNGNWVFDGYIDDVAVFPSALSQNQVMGLFAAATGVSLPTISTQPVPQMLYAGRTATFSVAATTANPPLTYQWRKNGNPLTDSGNISGSTSATLTISNLVANNSGNYDVVVTGSGDSGSAYSRVASLTVLPLPTEPYAAAVLAANPLAFYQFNDPGDPATNASAFDYVGGFVGTYGTAVQNGLYGIAGPTSANGFPGFAATNTAAEFFNGQGASQVTVPSWNLTTNTVTITAWIYPTDNEASGYRGVVMCTSLRYGLGLGYSGSTDASGNYTLGYGVDGTSFWNSGIAAPPGQWSMVALVVAPTSTTMYVMNTNGVLSATTSGANAAAPFTAPTLIGQNNANNGGGGAWGFDGYIDDVAVFASALSPSQVAGLFLVAETGSITPPPVTLQVQRSGTNVQLIWSEGILLQATNVTGPWTVNDATSPYTVTPTALRMLYRVLVQ
jgi:hypothetical protein